MPAPPKSERIPLPPYLQPRMAALHHLHIIRVAATKLNAAYVEPETLKAWGVQTEPMPLEPREFSAAAPFFKPMPLAKLAGAYERRWEAQRDEYDRWSQPGPEWRGSSVVPQSMMAYFERLLGNKYFGVDSGLRALSEWEWQRFASPPVYSFLSFKSIRNWRFTPPFDYSCRSRPFFCRARCSF